MTSDNPLRLVPTARAAEPRGLPGRWVWVSLSQEGRVMTAAETCWCGHPAAQHGTDLDECRVCFCSGFYGGVVA